MPQALEPIIKPANTKPKKINIKYESPEIKEIISNFKDLQITDSNYNAYMAATGKLAEIIDYRNRIFKEFNVFKSYFLDGDENILETICYEFHVEQDLTSKNKYPTYIIKAGEMNKKYAIRTDIAEGNKYCYSYVTNKRLVSFNKFGIHGGFFHIIDKEIYKSLERTCFDKFVEMVIESNTNYNNKFTYDNLHDFILYRKRFPEIDNLINRGLQQGVVAVLQNLNLYDIVLKGENLKKNIPLPKDVIAHFHEKPNIYNCTVIGYINEMQLKTKAVTLGILAKIEEISMSGQMYYYHSNNFFGALKDIVVKHDVAIPQAIDYLERVNHAQAFEPNSAITQWRDYLDACVRAERVTYDKYPNSLKREHDIWIREAGHISNADNREQFARVMREYEDIDFKNDKYCIVVPLDAQDLIKEGDALRHCVGSYIGSVANRICTIFFVRDKDEPEKPLYTLEVRKGGVKGQLHGFSNKNAPKDAHIFAQDFINKSYSERLYKGKFEELSVS